MLVLFLLETFIDAMDDQDFVDVVEDVPIVPGDRPPILTPPPSLAILAFTPIQISLSVIQLLSICPLAFLFCRKY